jgi:hypothetical protein
MERSKVKETGSFIDQEIAANPRGLAAVSRYDPRPSGTVRPVEISLLGWQKKHSVPCALVRGGRHCRYAGCIKMPSSGRLNTAGSLAVPAAFDSALSRGRLHIHT